MWSKNMQQEVQRKAIMALELALLLKQKIPSLPRDDSVNKLNSWIKCAL